MKQWDKIFKKSGKVFIKTQEDIPKIAKLFKERGVKKILDLGCGSGRHTVYLAKCDFKVYGIDIAKYGIRIARKWLKEKKLKAYLKIGDIYQTLPYGDNSFDAVISVQTLHHGKIEKIRKLIREIERILKSRGLLFITVRKALKVKGWRRNKIVIHKFKNRKTRYKVVGPRIYVPIEGGEKGLIHFSFNMKLIRKEFKNFKIFNIWIKKGHYCFFAELKNH